MTDLEAATRAGGDNHALEVLIREAEQHGRRRRAVNLAIAIVAFSMAAALVAVVVVSRSSPSATNTGNPGILTGRTVGDGAQVPSTALPPGIDALTSISCTAPAACVAVGSGGVEVGDMAMTVTTSNGGASWSLGRVPSSIGYLSLVSCKASTCMATGYVNPSTAVVNVLRSTDGGRTWTDVRLPGARASVSATACSSASSCLVVDPHGVYVTTDQGATWRLAKGAPHPIGNVDCSTATTCLATTSTAGEGRSTWAFQTWRSTDGGASWSYLATVGGVGAPRQLDCLSASTCSALVATTGYAREELARTSDGGATWSIARLPLADADAATCVTATTCVVWARASSIAQQVDAYRTTDGGSTWQHLRATPALLSVSAATCAPSGRCELVGADTSGVLALRSGDAGRSWTLGGLPAGVVTVTATACRSVTSCVVATRATRGGAIYTTTSGGARWTQSIVPAGTTYPTAVTCPTATFCAAAANGILISTDRGRTWTRAPYAVASRYGVGASLNAIACASSSSCVAVGGSEGQGNALPLHGRPVARPSSLVLRWSRGTLRRVPLPSTSTADLTAVSCPSATTCLAVGWQLAGLAAEAEALTSSDGGATWVVASIPANVDALRSLSCPSPTTCFAAGQLLATPGTEPALLASTDGGRLWTEVPILHRIGEASAIACASPNACVALGDAESHASNVDLTILLVRRSPGGPLRWSLLGGPSNDYRVIGTLGTGGVFGVREDASYTRPHVARVHL